MANKKRKDGYIKTSFTEDGKRYYVYGKNQKELAEKMAEKRKNLRERLEIRTDPSIEEYFTKRIEYRADGLKSNTIRNLKRAKNSICKIYVESCDRKFGEIKVKKLTADDLRFLQLKLSETCKTESVNNYMAKLKHVICDAVRERIIVYNPFDLISPLKRTEERARDTYHRALTIEEQTAFFHSELLNKSRYRNVLRMGILTGMRIGEIGALKYKDIKPDFIEVKRTITRINGDAWGVGEDTKTKAGQRKIPLTNEIKEVIEDQRAINALRGENIIDLEKLIFVGPKGGIVQDQYVNEDIKKICKHEGIEPFTSHALRDTFATRAIECEMNPKTLQEILGHKDFAITMNLYCHVLDKTKENEMKKLRILI